MSKLPVVDAKTLEKILLRLGFKKWYLSCLANARLVKFIR